MPTIPDVIAQSSPCNPYVPFFINILYFICISIFGAYVLFYKSRVLASIEREQLLKKEVYLECIKDLNDSLGVYTSLINTEISSDDIKPALKESGGGVAKLQLVASEDTLKSVENLRSTVEIHTMELIVDRIAVVEAKNELDHLNAMRKIYTDKMAKEYDKTVASFNSPDEAMNKFSEIRLMIDSLQEVVDEKSAEISKAETVFYKRISDFSDKCMNYLFRARKLIPPVVLSIRKEIKLEIAEQKYLKIVSDSLDREIEAHDEAMREIRKKMGLN